MSNDVPAHLQKLIAEELHGDRIHWSGMPNPWRSAVSASLQVVIGMIWLAIVISMAGAALRTWSEGNKGSLVVLIPAIALFLAGALYILLSPVFAMRDAKRTVIAVSDRRVHVVRDGRTRKAIFANIDHIARVDRTDHPDGTGTLVLTLGNGYERETDRKLRLIGISEARFVERLLRGPGTK